MLKIKRKPNIISADFPEGTVLLDARTKALYFLNPSARAVWAWLSRSRSYPELTRLLIARCGVDKKKAGRDLKLLLGDLQGKGLLEYVAAK